MAKEGKKAFMVLKSAIEDMKEDLDVILDYAEKRLIGGEE